jgi:alpha-tubulin suppressor-like RCC1 family protein
MAPVDQASNPAAPYAAMSRVFRTLLIGGGLALPVACGSAGPPSRLSAGEYHTCAIDGEGRAYCWGGGEEGAIGNGSTAEMVFRPEQVAGEQRWVAVAAGSTHSCGITSEGTALCWGSGRLGKRGDGTEDKALIPTPVAGESRWKGLSAALSHTCGVTADGQGFCWGEGENGELGTGSMDTTAIPLQVTGDHRWAMIRVSSSHSCGLTTAQEAYCWGIGQTGELGIGGSRQDRVPFDMVGEGPYQGRLAPTLVVGSHRWRDIAVGHNFTCGVTTDGLAYCWGSNGEYWNNVEFGRLGVSGIEYAFEPIAVSGGLRFTAITAGESHACGITAEGEAYCWGNGQYGRLGHGGSDNRSTPTPVEGGHTWLAVDAGNAHTCGVTKDTQFLCWGAVGLGRLGSSGGHALSPRPVRGDLGISPTARAERSKPAGKAPVWAEGSFEEAEMIGDDLGAKYRGAGTMVERRYLSVRDDFVTLVISQRVRGFGGGVECRGRPEEGVRSRMALTLECDQGPPVRVEMEFDEGRRAWSVRLDDDSEANPYRRR